MLTLNYITSSVVAASWCGGHSISTHHKTPLQAVVGRLTGICYLNEIIQLLVLPGVQQTGGGTMCDNARHQDERVVTDCLG